MPSVPGEAKLARIINGSWDELAQYLGTGTARRLIADNQPGQLLLDAPFDEWLTKLDKVQPTIQENVLKAVKREIKSLPAVGANLSFNVIDAQSVKYAATQSSTLIRNLSDTARQNVRHVMGRALAGEYTVDSAARAIRSTVGLHPAWSDAVMRRGERIYTDAVKNGMDDVKARALAGTKMDQHAKKLTAVRAKNIARTEIQTASNNGVYAGWETAIQGGYADPLSLKEWEPGPRACGICAPMSGQKVMWDQPFSNGVMMPPGHPSCRCSATLLPPDAHEDPLVRDIDWTNPNLDMPTTVKPPKAPKADDMFSSQLAPGARPYIVRDGKKQYVDILSPDDMPVKPGKPLSMDEAMQGVNTQGDAVQYGANCSSCSTAYEMRRRGFPVQAGGGVREGRLANQFEDDWWHNADGTPVSKSIFLYRSEMKEWMDAQPDGARGYMHVIWKMGGGHVFNWEKVGGKIRYIDTQITRTAGANPLTTYEDWGPRAMDMTSAIRIDDKIPNKGVKEAVVDQQEKYVPSNSFQLDMNDPNVQELLRREREMGG